MAVVDNHDFIIIDGAPQIADLAIAAIKCADMILIPVQPSPYDIWACEDLVEIIKARQEITDGKPKAAFIISRVIKNTQLGKEIREALEGYNLPVFKNFTTQRVVYAKSAATGLTVLSSESKEDAANEIRAIANELKDFL
jgi:chromosome partitioning protein